MKLPRTETKRAFSWQRLKWLWEAFRTGRSFAEVALLSRVIYRVEHLFLIHRETCQLLLHLTHPDAVQDSNLAAEMLQTMQAYTPATILSENETTLEEFRVGRLQIEIASSAQAYLVAVTRGDPPRDSRGALQQTLRFIQGEQSDALANFPGDLTAFVLLRPKLEMLLIARYRDTPERPRRNGRVKWLASAVLAGLIAAAAILGLRHERQWDAYVARLRATPGIELTETQRNWTGPSHIKGLRDPLAPDPAVLAREAQIDAAGISFDWKPYEAQYPAFIRRRFETAFAPPTTVTTRVENGVLHLKGSASYEWVDRVRHEASRLTGVQRLADDELTLVFAPDLVLKRFIDHFGLPDGMEARMGPKNRVVLWGEATHDWLARVRLGLKDVPGAFEIDDRKVVDLDLQTYKRTKTAIESTFIDLGPGKDALTSEQFMELSRLSDQIRRCLESAKRLGYTSTVEIRGKTENMRSGDPGQRATSAVRQFLVDGGLSSGAIRVVDRDAPSSNGEAMPEQAGNQIAFRVVLAGPAVP